jgi:hypothetical protein
MNSGDLTRTQNGGYAIGGGILGLDSDFPGYHVDPLNVISSDYVVIETDSMGNLQYQHCYGSYLNDAAYGISLASDNGLFVVGNSVGNNGNVSGHHGNLTTDDIWILKFAPTIIGVHNQVKPLHTFKVYPNPVSTTAKIAFYLPVANKVTVSIYDLSGKEIKTLMDENLTAGFQQMNWDCTTDDQQQVSNGIYMVRITAGAYAAYSKITVIR